MVEDGRAATRAVEVGLSNDDEAEIKSGLKENETVVLAPETNLADGQAVRVFNRAR